MQGLGDRPPVAVKHFSCGAALPTRSLSADPPTWIWSPGLPPAHRLVSLQWLDETMGLDGALGQRDLISAPRRLVFGPNAISHRCGNQPISPCCSQECRVWLENQHGPRNLESITGMGQGIARADRQHKVDFTMENKPPMRTSWVPEGRTYPIAPRESPENTIGCCAQRIHGIAMGRGKRRDKTPERLAANSAGKSGKSPAQIVQIIWITWIQLSFDGPSDGGPCERALCLRSDFAENLVFRVFRRRPCEHLAVPRFRYRSLIHEPGPRHLV